MWGLFIVGILCLLVLWFYRNRKLRKELIKLQETYNEKNNLSRPSTGEAPCRSSGTRESVITKATGERDTSGDSEPRREIVLPPTVSIEPIEDKREPTEPNVVNTKPKKRFPSFRRK